MILLIMIIGFFFFFFFFQAEDGIRDGTVTGVKTCALPIWPVVGLGQLRAGRQGAGKRLPGGPRDQIGRASCRERVESSVGAGGLKRKRRGREGELVDIKVEKKS